MAGTVHETSRNIGELMPRLEAADSERYLYRGQNGVFGPDGDFTRQIPAVFRGCTSPADARKALRKSRRRAAWLFDSVRKAAQVPADDSTWSLPFAAIHLGDLSRPQSPSAILGLVQHYGIPTECLDLTNLEPAAVFATQRWLTIDEALALRPGQLVPPASRGELAFIYRYDVEKLLELGLPVGDLSTGNVGSRPVLQEARSFALDFDQDRQLFAAGAYEVFPFRLSRIPYVYRRPVKPSPILGEEQRMALHGFSDALMAGLPIAIRDLVIPRLFFSEYPENSGMWRAYLGDRPDPFLVLGRLIERELHRVRDLDSYEPYAELLFGDFYEHTIVEEPMTKNFLLWLRRFRKLRDEPSAPEMIEIAPGEFTMGSETAPAAMYIDETPATRRKVDRPFAVGRYPVTFAEIRPFFEASGPSSEIVDLIDELGDDARRLPAVLVTWYEAQAYCQWLSKRTGQRYRLLTEVEWEYACRAGTTTHYWWGDAFDPWRANTQHETIRRQTVRMPASYAAARIDLQFLTPVDRFEANPWGLQDMLGNTWEWVEDVYDDPRTNPRAFAPQLPGEPFRCTRGGSWMDPPLSLRSATRSWAAPSARDRNIGFRVAREM